MSRAPTAIPEIQSGKILFMGGFGAVCFLLFILAGRSTSTLLIHHPAQQSYRELDAGGGAFEETWSTIYVSVLFVVIGLGIIFCSSCDTTTDLTTPIRESQSNELRPSSSTTDESTGSVSKNTREFLVRRMQQGIILKIPQDDNRDDDDNDGDYTLAYFGTDDLVATTSCTICLVDYEQGDRVVTSYCRHVFHKDCLLDWVILNKDCPCCRQLFVDPEAASLRPVLALY